MTPRNTNSPSGFGSGVKPRTVQIDGMEITFPPGTTPDQVEQWVVSYWKHVPGPWFGPEDVL